MTKYEIGTVLVLPDAVEAVIAHLQGFKLENPNKKDDRISDHQEKSIKVIKNGRQAMYNKELVRNNDHFVEWIIRARSFHDTAKLLAYFLNLNSFPEIMNIGKNYFLNKTGTASIYPAFFYTAAHSIELLLKAVAILYGKKPQDLQHTHDIAHLMNILKETDFVFPEFSQGEKNILDNFRMVLSSGMAKYPNVKEKSKSFFRIIEERTLKNGKERIVYRDGRKKDFPQESTVGIVTESNEDFYKIQEILPIMENSLDINSYNKIWQKISYTLDRSIEKWLQAEGAILP